LPAALGGAADEVATAAMPPAIAAIKTTRMVRLCARLPRFIASVLLADDSTTAALHAGEPAPRDGGKEPQRRTRPRATLRTMGVICQHLCTDRQKGTGLGSLGFGVTVEQYLT
jgi:hypothetical protein